MAPLLVLMTSCRGAPATSPAPATAPSTEPQATVLVSPTTVVPTPEPKPVPPPTHVIIISEDGLRPDLFSDELTPAHMQLIHAGTTARVARTIEDSDTLPSHASMLSGFPEKDHRLSWNNWHPERGYIHVPTIFSIAKQHGLSTAMFVGKPKLKHIAPPGSVDVYERPGYFCSTVVKRAGEYFTASRPALMFVHFSDPDEYGHASGWMSNAYLKGVRNSDRCLGELLATVRATGLGEQTLIIVTADHGGHGHAHSGPSKEVDREIPWIAIGPGVAQNSVLDADVSTVDTAATALGALGLPLPPQIAGLPRIRFN
jgi:predicted AlkP superfamily pyrophosphatase or phosphodiesterase